MKKYYKFLFFVVLSFIACKKNDIDDKGFSNAVKISKEVEDKKVWQNLLDLVGCHANDVKVNNSGFMASEGFPSADLSRDSAMRYIFNALTKMGYRTDSLKFKEDGLLTACNIVAELPGTSKVNEVVLIGVHHDAFFLGADDNSSAVAAMLETARILSQRKFMRTIRFVSFDLEEFGCIGSTRYVQAGYANDVVSAIVMDVIGYSSEEPGSQKKVMGLKVPDVGNYLFIVGNERSSSITQNLVALNNSFQLTKVHGVIAPGDGVYFLSSNFMRSDHGLLWYKNIPAVFLSDGANFRNPHYHKSSDTPENLNPTFLANNTRLLTAATVYLAEQNP